MVLFVDETENDEFFIVTGLLVNSQAEIDVIYNRFKKRANKLRISPKSKAKVFTEFKSTILDRSFQRVKNIMLEELNSVDYCVIYSCYIKKTDGFNQETKEYEYIKLLSRIVKSIDSIIDVIFDTFNKKDFEKLIISSISELDNVNSIVCCNSQRNTGLQYVDNLCSVYRHHLSETDKYGFYDKVCEHVKIV